MAVNRKGWSGEWKKKGKRDQWKTLNNLVFLFLEGKSSVEWGHVRVEVEAKVADEKRSRRVEHLNHREESPMEDED